MDTRGMGTVTDLLSSHRKISSLKREITMIAIGFFLVWALFAIGTQAMSHAEASTEQVVALVIVVVLFLVNTLLDILTYEE